MNIACYLKAIVCLSFELKITRKARKNCYSHNAMYEQIELIYYLQFLVYLDFMIVTHAITIIIIDILSLLCFCAIHGDTINLFKLVELVDIDQYIDVVN